MLNVLTSCTLTTGLLVRHMNAIPGAPQYTGQAYECLRKLDPDINECLTKSYEYWHEPDQSISISDDCCAKWDYIECSVNFLGAVNKSEHKCNESESNQLRQWFHKLEIFFANNSCSQYPKDSTFCLIPTLHNILITADKPPALNHENDLDEIDKSLNIFRTLNAMTTPTIAQSAYYQPHQMIQIH
ncbi:unnamed protein product [Oppiella nova]|uniref:Uncharacterized protein n=1 Tax=Oppiella nova TaxID=334625 RepID=A0A7R9LU32_9ACAR|nr:unnamed protein product [Oppiella nova]CAG2166965.1 unnamed protein product [Oppiella nova]